MRVFWVNIAISKLNLLYRYCLKLIGELRKDKDKKVERERRGISATLLPKFLCPNSCPSCEKKQLRQYHCRNRKKEIFFFGNCGNDIAKNGKKNWMELWQCHCRKWEEKKKFVAKIWEEILKKVLRSQYFYNTFTTNHRWLVIISLNLILTLRLLF